ncbi:TIR domain-containing protein [Rhodococcus aetherivorans]|uniref:TIR domain-containing protein n=1 Tax=Rhodococcus aetherivorans TaxID=191292 RepID=UPI00388DF2A3
MENRDFKVFISWSGTLSKLVAREIHDWLPQMLDCVDPWMSDSDIPAGLRGLSLIEDRLNASDFGIIVVTTENHEETWVNFEAGALSAHFGDSPTRVVPLLVNFESVYQVTSTLRQFQAVQLDKDGMRRLLESITVVAGAGWLPVKARFEWSWDEFWTSIESAKTAAGTQPKAKDLDTSDLLREVLDRLTSLEQATQVNSSNAASNQLRSVADTELPSVKHLRAHQNFLSRSLKKRGVNDFRVFWTSDDDGGPVATVSVREDLSEETWDRLRQWANGQAFEIKLFYGRTEGIQD